MFPFGHHTVTLLHRTDDGYARYTLDGCSWISSDVQTISDNAISRTVETTCRIPHPQQSPIPGDLLVLGVADIQADGEIALVRLLSSLRSAGRSAFRVQRVKDNTTGGLLPHYAAIGV